MYRYSVVNNNACPSRAHAACPVDCRPPQPPGPDENENVNFKEGSAYASRISISNDRSFHGEHQRCQVRNQVQDTPNSHYRPYHQPPISPPPCCSPNSTLTRWQVCNHQPEGQCVSYGCPCSMACQRHLRLHHLHRWQQRQVPSVSLKTPWRSLIIPSNIPSSFRPTFFQIAHLMNHIMHQAAEPALLPHTQSPHTL